MIKNIYKNSIVLDGDLCIWVSCHKKKSFKHGKVVTLDNGNIAYTDKTLEEALESCDNYLEDLFSSLQVDSYIIYLTGKKCFRYSVDDTYKSNRVGLEKPMWHQEVRQYLVDKYRAMSVVGLEADDLCILTKNNLESCFVASADKDVFSNEGTFYKLSRLGNEWITNTKYEAEYKFALSMILGDKADGILQLKKGMGIVGATKELEEFMSFKLNPLDAAFGMYKAHLGEYEGIVRFAKQYQMLKILDDLSQLPKGIEFEIPQPIEFGNKIEKLDEYNL